ncbi:MAG: choice-of-anchor tandem repeat NxxGxxAF-containing protein [Blastocatellia bacterium]
MQKIQRFALSILGVVLLCASASLFGASAQQPAAQQKPARPAGEDEPVAISERARVEKKVESKPLGEDQFGNFRYPFINNKGVIAFQALFPLSTGRNGSGQAVFIKHPDGTWKIMREGEKAVNFPEPIIALGGLPSFNDNGDVTFVAEFGGVAGKAAGPVRPVDPNDPTVHEEAPLLNRSLYVRTADGIKSLARLGDEVPNMPSRFTGFSNPTTNSQGVTAIIGTYGDPDGRGLFLFENGKPRIIVRSGQRVGLGIEGSYSEHYYPSQINERSEIAFLGRVGDKSGIFVSRPKGVELLAMTGHPGPLPNTNFIGFGNRAPGLNNKGEVAFAAFTDNADAQRALFFRGVEGPVKVVAKSGDRIADTGYAFSDFLSPAINARGDIAFVGLYGGRNRGLFIKTAKGIEPVALLEQQIPGGSKEELFNNFTQPSINDRGEIVFYAQMKNGEVGIFHRDEKGVLRTVVRRGDKMPK